MYRACSNDFGIKRDALKLLQFVFLEICGIQVDI